MAAETDTAVAEQDTVEAEFNYPITIEDAGPATKRVTVEIPADRINTMLSEQFKELRQQAAIPGFRVGHAPQKLIEKKFSEDIREQVRSTLIRESYTQAVEGNKLEVIGEPEFDNPDSLKLPGEGSLKYSFSVEVQPAITLPSLEGIKVKKPKIDVNDEHVGQALANLQEQQGVLVPVEDRGVAAKDYVTADVHIKLDGNVIQHAHGAQMISRPGKVAGIDVVDLDKQLEGLKVGDKKEFTVKVPETHANDQIRDKEVAIEVEVKDLKKLELAELTPEFLEDLGFKDQRELEEALREQMVERITQDIAQAQREQVHTYLLEGTQIELPAKMSDRQTDRVVQRRAMNLMMRGMPQDQIGANIDKLKAGAAEEGSRELKLFFILQKIATDFGVDVDEGELNGRVAMMAIQKGERPEKLKQTMSKDGSLSNLYVQLREHKAVDKLLEKAEIEEVDVAGGASEKKEDESSST